ncbi:hypothetical protein [Frankia sp. AiPs1]
MSVKAASFNAWTNRLRAEGYLVCPGSSAVPVDLRGVRRDGLGLHFRCRGTTVRLGVYRPGRAAWQVAVRDAAWCPEEALQLWVHRPLDDAPPPDGAMLAFPGSDGPDNEILLDGARLWGWTGHDAGLLPPDDASTIFDQLVATLPNTPEAHRLPAQPDRGADRQGRSSPAPRHPVSFSCFQGV